MTDSTSIVDFEQLLAPISEERPTGIDIREDESPTSAYYQIKDARNAARADERNQAAMPEAERQESQHWKTILDLAPRILTEQAKDLEVAAWYTEALLRKHGLAGLRDGFQLINNLISNFWDGLYPQEDEDGIETKIAPLAGLFGLIGPGSLAQPINCTPITDPGKEKFFAAWQYQQAQNLSRAPDAKTRNQRIKDGVPTIENLEKAAKQTSSSFYQALTDNLETSQIEFDKLFVQLENLAGEDVPNGSSVRKALNTINIAIKAIAKHVFTPLEPTADLAAINSGDTAVLDAEVSGMSLSANNIKQRDEAFATIQTIAEFFRKTEPHSPISYALERIVKWGDMQLPELLQELVEDKMAYEAYCKLTGIEMPKPPAPAAMPNQMGYNDPMNPAPLANPMDAGGYPPPPPMQGGMGDPMYNNTF